MGTLLCLVERGTQEDAFRRALGANSRHGLKRSNADKRKAVFAALAHPKIGKESNVKIAELCGVSDMTIGNIKRENGGGGQKIGVANNKTGSNPSAGKKPITSEESTSGEPREPWDDLEAATNSPPVDEVGRAIPDHLFRRAYQ